MTAADVDIREGDLFKSNAQTLVNTVNCVGVMGKGVALGFRKRFPSMYDDYSARCEQGQVRLGRPYLYKDSSPWVLNFPTKDHWRSMSKLSDIVDGLEYLENNYRSWGITSLAVPPLGAGHGGLEWHVVGPTLYRHLARLEIPVELYVPFGTPHQELQPVFLGRLFDPDLPETRLKRNPRSQVGPEWVSLLKALGDLESEPYRPLIGRTLFQKLAYFATESGLELGLNYGRSSYGPYAPEMKGVTSHLLNNGLIQEHRRGRMFEVRLGPTFEAALRTFESEIAGYASVIERLTDLLARMDTRRAEVAATVHFAAGEARDQLGRTPSEDEVTAAVLEWKQRRKPPFDPGEVAKTVRELNLLGWLNATPSAEPDRNPELELLGA